MRKPSESVLHFIGGESVVPGNRWCAVDIMRTRTSGGMLCSSVFLEVRVRMKTVMLFRMVDLAFPVGFAVAPDLIRDHLDND